MPRNKYTYELLAPVVQKSTTWADVCRSLGVKPFTGAQTHLKKRSEALGIDSSHFLGQAHGRGKKTGPKRTIEQLLASSTTKSHVLRLRLIKEGIKEARCEKCKLTEWVGEPIPLELDHINGDHWDSRLDNLQILCPNCHAQKTSHGSVAKRETR